MTLDELQSKLNEVRAWRKQELTNARRLAETAHNQRDQELLCRAWTLLLYAHCDQSLKESAKCYLSFLEHNPRDDYDYRTIWLSFRSKDFLINGSPDNYKTCETGPSKEQALNLIRSKEIFDNRSFSFKSLRFFMDWIAQVPFDSEKYKGFCQTLLKKRHEIAHGERTYVRVVEDCTSWHMPTILLLDDIVDSIMQRADSHANDD